MERFYCAISDLSVSDLPGLSKWLSLGSCRHQCRHLSGSSHLISLNSRFPEGSKSSGPATATDDGYNLPSQGGVIVYGAFVNGVNCKAWNNGLGFRGVMRAEGGSVELVAT